MDMPTSEIFEVLLKSRRFKEPEVCVYVKEMLKHLKLDGAFSIRIKEKIKGNSAHHGIEICNIEHSAVRMKVQYGDNGSRFLCFLSSNEWRAHDLFNLMCSKLNGLVFVRKEDECCHASLPVGAVAGEDVESFQHLKADAERYMQAEGERAKLGVSITDKKMAIERLQDELRDMETEDIRLKSILADKPLRAMARKYAKISAIMKS